MHEDTFFSTLHPLSLVIFATATEVALVLLRSSMFKFHCYTQREASPTQKSARKWCCNLSWLLVRTITMGIHSCKPASLNRPIHVHWQSKLIMCSIWVRTWCVSGFFLLPCHTGSHTPSSEDLPPFLETWMLLCNKLIMAEDSPHLTTQHI